MEELKRLYEELHIIKNEEDFKKNGFAVAHKYNRWLKEAEALKKQREPRAAELTMLGFQYALASDNDSLVVKSLNELISDSIDDYENKGICI